MTNKEDAVSGVIGGVLLIALVLIGAAIVGTYVASQPPPEKIPKVQFNTKEFGNKIYLEHEGGESLNKDVFQVIVNGDHIEWDNPYWNPEIESGSDLWAIGGRIKLDNDDDLIIQSIGLVYRGGSGETLLRYPKSPDGFNYVFPSYDPSEKVFLPAPEGGGTYFPWDGSEPDSWPDITASIEPQDLIEDGSPVDFSSKVAYVAAHNSKMTPSGSPLFVCGGDGNDEHEINEALSMMKGGTVILLDGDFYCGDRIRVPDHTRLTGQGSTETRIEVLPRSGGSGYLPVTLNQPYVMVEGFSLFGNGFVMVTTSHVRVRDITATSKDRTGQMRPASGNGMFFVWATTEDLLDIEFYECMAIDCHTHGYNMNQQWDIGGPDSQARTIGYVSFVSCYALNCGFGVPAGSRSEWITGFDFHEWHDLRHMRAVDCWAENNWESGFHLEPGGRYDANGDIIGARTISEDIHLINCTSKDNGKRNTYSGHFFMSGFYLSRDTHLVNCKSYNNANSGYYVHGGQDSSFTDCIDDGSTYGWKICKASSEITLTDCESWNNPRWGLWLSFSKGIHVDNFEQHNVVGDRGYQSILGWYKDEAKYQQSVTDSDFRIISYDCGMPIINKAGSGNTYDLSYG